MPEPEPSPTTYSFLTFCKALEAAKQGTPCVLVDVSNFDPSTVKYLNSSERPANLHAITHSINVGALSKYRADTSTECAFNFIADHAGESALELSGKSVIVSNDHFDHDGLAGVSVVLHQEWAKERKDLLIEVSKAGDFLKFRDHTAARIAWTIDAFSNRVEDVKSPLPATTFKFKDFYELFDNLYTEMIPRFQDIVDNIDSYESSWKSSEENYETTLAAITSGTIRVTKYLDLSLAFVYVPTTYNTPVSIFAIYTYLAYLSEGGDCYIVATATGADWQVKYRYESHVDLVSTPIPPCIDLAPVAKHLSSIEPSTSNAKWVGGDPNDAHVAALKTEGKTAIADEVVERELVGWLRGARGFDKTTTGTLAG
ncbi:hypothetical protein M427DRAFT_156124 [Gonapodya prolifera JEL478]|uniref:Uncharacterized protein n=1 Tax=Gonapodya prolifera (strain JEL478) TaxID=1344416 RepID=A0A139ACE5_GONPJ|nr:hypothetical protein M427DRAFT_156124 [Gonapodya prolifera JEL478]|eukprot:KXS14093.1 hypothetical protein M427DRAFT_156124 [Gonapodya prolifera JEL478]